MSASVPGHLVLWLLSTCRLFSLPCHVEPSWASSLQPPGTGSISQDVALGHTAIESARTLVANADSQAPSINYSFGICGSRTLESAFPQLMYPKACKPLCQGRGWWHFALE